MRAASARPSVRPCVCLFAARPPREMRPIGAHCPPPPPPPPRNEPQAADVARGRLMMMRVRARTDRARASERRWRPSALRRQHCAPASSSSGTSGGGSIDRFGPLLASLWARTSPQAAAAPQTRRLTTDLAQSALGRRRRRRTLLANERKEQAPNGAQSIFQWALINLIAPRGHMAIEPVWPRARLELARSPLEAT